VPLVGPLLINRLPLIKNRRNRFGAVASCTFPSNFERSDIWLVLAARVFKHRISRDCECGLYEWFHSLGRISTARAATARLMISWAFPSLRSSTNPFLFSATYTAPLLRQADLPL
jgi:hypothetical protein